MLAVLELLAVVLLSAALPHGLWSRDLGSGVARPSEARDRDSHGLHSGVKSTASPCRTQCRSRRRLHGLAMPLGHALRLADPPAPPSAGLSFHVAPCCNHVARG
jgi:hypothetical protein